MSGNETLHWILSESKVIIHLFNASTSEDFEGDTTVDFGRKGMI